MNQESAGQQASKSPKGFLDEYVGEIVRKLQDARNPTDFSRIANGAIGQTVSPDNKDYYG